jgi:hypothetical protein
MSTLYGVFVQCNQILCCVAKIVADETCLRVRWAGIGSGNDLLLNCLKYNDI